MNSIPPGWYSGNLSDPFPAAGLSERRRINDLAIAVHHRALGHSIVDIADANSVRGLLARARRRGRGGRRGGRRIDGPRGWGGRGLRRGLSALAQLFGCLSEELAVPLELDAVSGDLHELVLTNSFPRMDRLVRRI